MEIKVNKSELKKALSIVSKAIPSNPPSPILKGVLFEIKENKLIIFGTDLEIGITTKINCKTDDEKEVVIPMKLLRNYVGKLKEKEIKLIFEEDKMKIINGNSKMSLNLLNPEDYPQKNNTSEFDIKIEQSKLKQSIKKTKFAVSQNKEEQRSAIKGLKFEIENNIIRTIGTNTFRMAVEEQKVDIDKELSFVIPYRVSKILENLLSEGKTKISIRSNMIYFDLGKYKIMSRTIAGDYPNYEMIIPDTTETIVTFDKDKLKSAVDRATLLNEENVIKINFDKETLITELENESQVGHIEEKLDSDIEGDSITTFLDGTYILDVLKVIEGDNIIVEAIGPMEQFVFKDQNEGFQYIVMPIREH